LRYGEETAALVLAFGAGGAKKVAVTAAKAGETTATVAESAAAANKAARVARFEKGAGETVARLTPYGGPGGGHHIHMKSAFKSHPMYNLNKALCLSNEEMARLGINHLKVTKTQRALCLDLQKTGKELTREELNRISVEALVVGGANKQLARDIVAKSQWNLRSKGIRTPSDFPYKPR
jgi:hypothetical protein